jgi:hypothetical protein
MSSAIIQISLGDDGRLPGNIETLAAAHVLARHHVVLSHHVGSSLGEASAIALIGAARQLPLFSPHDPHDFVLCGLMAVWAIQRSQLLLLLLVEKIALFHRSATVAGPNRDYCTILRSICNRASLSFTFLARIAGASKEAMAKKKKVKRFRAVTAVKELARERVGAPPSGKIVIEKKKKPEKHKPTLGKLLESE